MDIGERCNQFRSSILQRFSLRIITLVMLTCVAYTVIYCGLCGDDSVVLPVKGVLSCEIVMLFVFVITVYHSAVWIFDWTCYTRLFA